MANTLGELIFDLVLNDAPFNAALKAAQERMDDFSKKMKASGASLSGVFNSARESVGDLSNVTNEYIRSSRGLERVALYNAKENSAKAIDLSRQETSEKIANVKKALSEYQATKRLEVSAELQKNALILQEQRKLTAFAITEDRLNASLKLAQFKLLESDKRKVIAEERRAAIAAERADARRKENEARAAIRASREAERAAQTARIKNQQAIDDLTSRTAIAEGAVISAMKATAASVVAVGGAITFLGARLENTLNQVAIIGGGGLEELTSAAKRFGSETEFSAQKAADAMLYFAQAGFEAEQNIAATESAIALASASGSDLAQTTQVVSNTITQFGLQASDSERIANTFAYALNASKLGMDDLSVSMRYAGTVGAGFGFTLEETSAAIIQLADLGLRGSKSGTVFRSAMSQAANATGAAEKALNKYGLTQEDINPQTQKFAGILKVVAENNIEVSDALKIFGDEAGANIVQLARNNKAFDEGTRAGLSYTKALKGIAEAQRSNLAAATAEEVSKTVFRQFLRLTSVISNFADDIYNTYSRQLLGLIEEAILLTNEVAQQFGIATSIINGGFGPALEGLTDFIRNNRTEIAAFTVSAIQTFSSLAGQVVQLGPAFYTVVQGIAQVFTVIEKLNGAVITLLPMFDNLLDLMISVWAVNRVYLFVTAIQGAITALQGFSTAASTAKISAELLAGGWVKTVAVLATLAVALTGYIALTAESEEATRRLADAQERQRLIAEGESDAEIARVNGILALQKERALGEIASGKEIDAQRRREIDTILELDAAGALLMLQKGKLIELDGELRTAASLYEQALNEASFEKLTVAYRRAGNEAEALKNRIEALRAKVEEYSNLRGQVSEETAGAAISAGTGENVRSLEEAQALLVRLTKQYEQRKTALVSFRAEAVLAEDEVRKSTLGTADATRNFATATKDAKASQDLLNQSLIQFQQILSDASNRYQEVTTAFRQAAMTEGEIEAERLQQRIESDNAIYDAAMIAAAALGDSTIDWEQRRLESEAMLRATYATRSMQEARKLAQDKQRLLAEETQTEEELRLARHEAELQGVNEAFDALVALHEGQTIILKGLEEQRGEALKAVRERYEAEVKKAAAEALPEPIPPAEVPVSVDSAGKVDSFVKKFIGGIERAKKAIAQLRVGVALIGKAFQTVLGIVTSISGFSFNILSMIQNMVTDIFYAQERAADEAARRAAEAGFDPEAARRRAMVANDPKVLARQQVNELADRAVSIAEIFAQAIGPILNTLAKRLPDIIFAVADAIPSIVTALSNNLGPIVSALLTSLTDLVLVIVDQIPDIVMVLVETLATEILPRLPEIGMKLSTAIVDMLFVDLLDRLPEIIIALSTGFIENFFNMLSNMPKILKSIVLGVFNLIKALLFKVPVLIVELAVNFANHFVAGVTRFVRQIGEGIANAVANFFGIDPQERQARREERQARREERRSNRAAYSGIDYVPATMRATLHQGEAVIPADRNMQRFKTAAPAPAGYAQNFGGGPAAAPSKVEVAVIAEGRLLEAVQLTAQSMGRANGMNKKIRRAAGVQVGFFRGQFNPFSV